MAKTIFAKDPSLYIPKLAESLKKIPEFKVPEWVFYVKSGTSRQRPPANKDFWYIRSASILRQLYIQGVVGVGRLRTKYGSKKDMGGRPDHFRKASGKIIRTILKQAEKAGLVEKVSKLQHGRRLTQKGRELLDSISVEEKKGLDFNSIKTKSILQEMSKEDLEENFEESEEEINEDTGEEE